MARQGVQSGPQNESTTLEKIMNYIFFKIYSAYIDR